LKKSKAPANAFVDGFDPKTRGPLGGNGRSAARRTKVPTSSNEDGALEREPAVKTKIGALRAAPVQDQLGEDQSPEPSEDSGSEFSPDPDTEQRPARVKPIARTRTGGSKKKKGKGKQGESSASSEADDGGVFAEQERAVAPNASDVPSGNGVKSVRVARTSLLL
jgi:hypothetical protein